MDEKEFRKIVDEALAHVPERFASRMENIALLVEDAPSDEVLRENLPAQADGIESGTDTLLGLYRGIPKTERGSDYGIGGTMPDTITLYRLPILRAAQEDNKKIADVVRETVWHEIAHYFGMEEGDVRRREGENTNRYKSP